MPKVSNPKISIIVPSYNRAEFIEATLVSIQNHTFKDFEVIFIDDGSTDNTAELVKAFCDKDPRFKYFKQENSERAVARSYGLGLATADLLCLVDSDDLWYSHKLEKQVEVMDADPSVALCYAAVNRIDMEGNPTKTSSRQHQGLSGFIFYDLLMRNFIPSVTPMFRKKAFEKVGSQVTEFIPYEDWDFWLKFSRQGKFHHISEPLGDYRLHPGQSVKNVRAEHIEKVTTLVLDNNTKKENININSYKNRSFDSRDFDEQVKEAYSLANLRFAYWYLVSGNRALAKDRLIKSCDYSNSRKFDYRWYGLWIAYFMNPVCGDSITKLLGSFH
jgi:glycosyltransferase involved in cell wall biosynthesis